MSLDDYEFIRVSMKVAKRIGLNATVCATILNAYAKSPSTLRRDDMKGKFGVMISDLSNDTSLSSTEVKSALNVLSAVNWVECAIENDVAWCSIDVKREAELLTRNDSKFVNEIKTSLKRLNGDVKRSKKARINNALKNHITVNDENVKQSLCRWVDSLSSSRKITKDTVEMFQKTLLTYAKDDQKKIDAIIDLAIANQYSNCLWAIDAFEKQNALNLGPTRKSELNVASLESISSKRF